MLLHLMELIILATFKPTDCCIAALLRISGCSGFALAGTMKKNKLPYVRAAYSHLGFNKSDGRKTAPEESGYKEEPKELVTGSEKGYLYSCATDQISHLSKGSGKEVLKERKYVVVTKLSSTLYGGVIYLYSLLRYFEQDVFSKKLRI